MNNFLNFGLLLCIQLVTSVSLHATESENCEDCTKYFDDQTAESGSLRNQILGLEPFKYQGSSSCTDCVISGMHDFKRIEGEQICVTKSANGEIRRSIPIEFQNITSYCDCQLSSDHTESMKKMIKALWNPTIIQCVLGRIAKAMDQNIDLFLPTIDQDDIVRMGKCLPLIGKLIQDRKNLKDFRIASNWQNAKFRFDLVTKPGQHIPVIENIEILQNDTVGMTPQCDGNDLITEYCKCTMEGKYVGHTIIQILKLSLPCYREMYNQINISDVLINMACPV